MRYQAVELYSGVLRAIGWLLAIIAVAGALLFGGIGAAFGGVLNSMAIVGAAFIAITGLVGGLGLVAIGQLLCVFVDIEANTRTLIHREWQIDR